MCIRDRRLGKDFTLDDLFNEGFNAVFIGVGCAKGMKLGFPEDKDVYKRQVYGKLKVTTEQRPLFSHSVFSKRRNFSLRISLNFRPIFSIDYGHV